MLLPYQLNAGSQALDAGGHAFTIPEHGRPGHEHVGSRFHSFPGRFGIDASIHLEIACRLDPLDHLADAPDL
jgi:hypothetical protein